MNPKPYSALSSLLAQAERIVFFTGAGISTESGIPDFRGPQGVWKTVTPIDFNDFISSEESRRLSWRRKFTNAYQIDNSEPNSGHNAITTLFKLGKVTKVITQNVDGLHQKAGIAEQDLVELHGNANYATCLDCHHRYELDWVQNIFNENETLPYCEHCGGMVKTATISFGQAMPVEEMNIAQEACENTDLLIVLGSSLSVYPAAALPQLAKQGGASLIIINNEATPLDGIFDLVLNKAIGETLSEAVGALS